MAIPACWAGVLVIAIGSIWFALEWNKTRKIQFAVEFGGELWGKGAKNQAVEQYRSILPILPSDDQAAVIYQRVIEFDLEKGNRESAKSLMHHALDRGLILAFDSREAAELLGEIKSKSTVEEPDAEDTTTAPVAQKTTEVRNTGNKHAKHVESTIGVTASSAPAADIPPQFDFSKVDYSIPKVDYSKGPNGEKLVVREVQNPTNGKPLTVTGFQSSNRDFVWHGLVICWYEKPRQGFRGKKMVEAYWYVDKEHGRHIEWHEDGILMYECSKKDGLRHGQSVDYDEKGQKDEEGWWLNGKKHGRFLTWKNGKPACEEQYVNGELQGIDFSKVDYTVPPYKGPKRDFTKGPNGEEVREKEERYPDGTIKRRFHFYVNSSGKEVEHGLSTEWYPNGKKKKEVTDWDGVAHGILVEWYDNGQKTREAETAKGNWNGLSTYWYPSGQMMKQGTSKDGKNHGKWTGWYENGKKQEEMTWLDGEEYGPRKVWWENGNQHLECYYVGGEVHGQVTRWRSSGVKMPANKCQAYYDGFESGAKVGQNFVAGIHKGGFVGTEILRSARDFYSEQRRTYIELRSMETQPGWSGYGDGGRTVQTLEGVIDGFRDAMLEAGVSFD
jgi:antitoxin component YwqK of YwqJK toxin-antitoxin module